jgi:hypothetical protein
LVDSSLYHAHGRLLGRLSRVEPPISGLAERLPSRCHDRRHRLAKSFETLNEPSGHEIAARMMLDPDAFSRRTSRSFHIGRSRGGMMSRSPPTGRRVTGVRARQRARWPTKVAVSSWAAASSTTAAERPQGRAASTRGKTRIGPDRIKSMS